VSAAVPGRRSNCATPLTVLNRAPDFMDVAVVAGCSLLAPRTSCMAYERLARGLCSLTTAVDLMVCDLNAPCVGCCGLALIGARVSNYNVVSRTAG
jgi:hypothetical protein